MPAGFLRHVEPWRASYSQEQLPQWNPLMYDSVGQFYPWRKFASDTLHSGYIPLWNPYQFCGTPFVANSQSAVFYPGNLLFYILPPATAAGWSAWLHLILAASWMYVFMRGLGLGEAPSAISGIVFAFSAWEISWLHLPTFLATSCWLPLVVHLTRRIVSRPSLGAGAALAGSTGCCLLAGHLQIAFYALLASMLAVVFLSMRTIRSHGFRVAIAPLALWVAATTVGGMLAAVQIVLSLELSRQSHRVGSPTAAGYRAYTDYSVGADGLATLFVPDFFNNPSNPNSRYFGTSKGGKLFNYAEGAMYVGLLPLALALVAILKRRSSSMTPYLGGLAVLALLMALGTAIDALFYFYVPGFGQSGSPGRSLILWTFAIAALAGLGIHSLSEEEKPTARSSMLAIGILAIAATVVIALGLQTKNLFQGQDWDPGFGKQATLAVLSFGVLFLCAKRFMRAQWRAPLILLVISADLISAGLTFNPTSPAKDVYPSTQLTEFLRTNTGHDRIAPINQNWSMSGPKAVLPPNGALALGLRDIQGYDSLFPGRYKAYMNRLAEPAADASPPEVGNMVFAKNPQSPLLTAAGVRYILSRDPLDLPNAKESYLDQVHVYEMQHAAGRAYLDPATAGASIEWKRDDATRIELLVTTPASARLHLADQLYEGWVAEVDGRSATIARDNEVFRAVNVPSGRHTVSFEYHPISFRFGLFVSLCAAALLTLIFFTSRRGIVYAIPSV